METQTDNQRPDNGQLISVARKDTIRLLEVYVKRSLSLNDGTLGDKKSRRKEKWVTMPSRGRRHSSDPSIHLCDDSKDDELDAFSAIDSSADQLDVGHEDEKPTPKKIKIKKSSFWKNIFGFFSRKSSEDKDGEDDSSSDGPDVAKAEEAVDAVTACLPTAPVTVQKKKSMRRKSIKRRFSKKRKSITKIKDLNAEDISRVEAVVSVQPTYSYYEKVSEELEKIVHEVQENEEAVPLSDEEIINKIIALTREQSDAIDCKLRDNPTLNNFFQQMPYSSFRKLADAYLELEASPTHNPPTVLPTAPELVKLAFTYDFTAKVARLSKQNVGHITGLGNRYLQDRFEYKEIQKARTDHPGLDSDG